MEKDKERMLELLADQILFGLTKEEKGELERLKISFPEFRNDNSFEMAAAAVSLINLGTEDSLPSYLQSKLEIQSAEFFGNPQQAREFSSFEKNQSAELPQDVFARSIDEFAPKPLIWQWFGWAVAAAACIALALNLWLTRVQPKPDIARNSEPVKTPEVFKTPAPELTAAQRREQLLASAPDVIQTNWTSAKDEKKVLGDLVWSNSEQKGYIRLRELPVLDASRETYQLWIVDKEQNQKTPVSGGVFEINQAGEVVIPIDAQLKIKKPVKFAVSKEKSGGVVVSSPERFVAIAKV